MRVDLSLRRPKRKGGEFYVAKQKTIASPLQNRTLVVLMKVDRCPQTLEAQNCLAPSAIANPCIVGLLMEVDLSPRFPKRSIAGFHLATSTIAVLVQNCTICFSESG